jgi:hypothetical protein
MFDSLPPVRQPNKRFRYKPKAALGDAGYGFLHIVRQVVARRVASLLAPRQQRGYDKPIVHGSGFGKIRYVVERTVAWLANFRRIAQCYERTGESWRAFNELACCVICAQKIERLEEQKMVA